MPMIRPAMTVPRGLPRRHLAQGRCDGIIEDTGHDARGSRKTISQDIGERHGGVGVDAADSRDFRISRGGSPCKSQPRFVEDKPEDEQKNRGQRKNHEPGRQDHDAAQTDGFHREFQIIGLGVGTADKPYGIRRHGEQTDGGHQRNDGEGVGSGKNRRIDQALQKNAEDAGAGHGHQKSQNDIARRSGKRRHWRYPGCPEYRKSASLPWRSAHTDCRWSVH